MGIRSFSSFISQYAPDSSRQLSIRDISCEKIALDVSVYIHKYFIACHGNLALCFAKFKTMYENFTRYGIAVIFVFDGVPSESKIDTLKARKQRRVRTKRAHPPKYVFDMLKHDLTRSGFNCLTSFGDAEKACSWLCKNSFVDAVVTEDFDALPFGAPMVIRNVRGKNVNVIQKEEILRSMGWSETQFISFCVLCGCDFSSYNFGPDVSVELIRSGVYKTYESSITSVVAEFKNSEVPLADFCAKKYIH